MLVAQGHEVRSRLAQASTADPDAQFIEAGAKMIEDVNALWAQSEMIVKVKEPVEEEYVPKDNCSLRISTWRPFHLWPRTPRKESDRGGHETIALPDGRLPLLQPMSMVAGKMSVQIGANLLESHNGGKGVLLGGVPGHGEAESSFWAAVLLELRPRKLRLD